MCKGLGRGAEAGAINSKTKSGTETSVKKRDGHKEWSVKRQKEESDVEGEGMRTEQNKTKQNK